MQPDLDLCNVFLAQNTSEALNFGKGAAFVLVLLEFQVSEGDRLAVLISKKFRDSFRGRF